MSNKIRGAYACVVVFSSECVHWSCECCSRRMAYYPLFGGGIKENKCGREIDRQIDRYTHAHTYIRTQTEREKGGATGDAT